MQPQCISSKCNQMLQIYNYIFALKMIATLAEVNLKLGLYLFIVLTMELY